jgi:hypothetical protein
MFKCDECGFDASTLDDAALIDAIASQPKRYRAPLTRFLPNEDGDALLRRRPAPDVWSALEYAAHQRDTIAFYGTRIEMILTTDRPQLLPIDPDAEAIAGDYNALDPVTVADAIAEGATSVAARLSTIAADDWERVGIAIDGSSERDVRNCARRLAHEGGHHLLDIGRSLRAARS